MKLTGKCKAEFEKWYLIWILNNKPYWSLHFSDEKILDNWKSLHNSEKYGVLVDFFDSVGFIIENCVVWSGTDVKINIYEYLIKSNEDLLWLADGYEDNLSKAREQAIDKANELYNTK